MFIALGLLYLPAAAFAAAIAVFARLIPFVGEFIELARPSGGTNLFMAALAGGAVNLAAFVGVSALVAEFLRGAWRIWQRDEAQAEADKFKVEKSVFRFSLLYLFLHFGALLAEAALRPYGFGGW